MERYRCAPISVIIIVTTADMNILDKQVEKKVEGYLQKKNVYVWFELEPF